MDIHITDLSTNESIQIPMMPEKINIAYESNFLSYDVLRIGEVKIPSGEKLAGIKWDGMFPGEARKNMPFVSNWQEPKLFHNWLEKVRTSGAKVRVLITETPINMDTNIASFTPEISGGFGDISYSISLIQAKDINITCETPATPTDPTTETPDDATDAPTVEIPHPCRPGPGPIGRRAAAKRTYTRGSNESLWDIAAAKLGDGNRWIEIYQLNRNLIGNDPLLNQPGQVYTLP